MITVPEVVEKIIKTSPFLEELLSEQIINLSSLARKIKPRIEKELYKTVKTGAILMALRRLAKNLKNKTQLTNTLHYTPDMIVRSNLVEFTFSNSYFLKEKYKKLVEELYTHEKHFLTITQGVFEITIIGSEELKEQIKTLLKGEKILAEFDHLSGITIRLPEGVIPAPGVYYSIFKTLAWEGISIVEVVSTFSEFTIILEDKEVDRAFSLLKKSFSNTSI